MNEEEIKRVLEQDAPSWWSPYDFDTAARAVAEQPDITETEHIAAVLWSMGHGTDHEDCRYAEGDGDADYENNCATCEKHSIAVAEKIRDAAATPGENREEQNHG